MKRGGPLERRKRLVSRKQLGRVTPLRSREAPCRRVLTTRRRSSGSDIPTWVRDVVRKRAGGYCEACGRPGPVHMHHRKLRSQGGRHDPVNLIHIHTECHIRIHGNPDQSYALGLLVRSGWDPADVPVRKFPAEPRQKAAS